MECLVCQVPNTGQHFGVSCCRACAAFFRRTLQLKLQYRCRFKNICDITHKNRYCCRACRMTKCYALGMGNHDNARRELLKRRTTIEQLVDGPSSSAQFIENFSPRMEMPNGRNFNIDMASFLKGRLDQIFRRPFQRQVTKVPLCEQALEAYKQHNANWPNCAPGKVIHSVVVDLNVFMQSNYMEIEFVANFCMSISIFAQMTINEKWLVFKHFWPRFVELDRTYVTMTLLGCDRDDTRIVNFDGRVVNFINQGAIGDLSEMSSMTENQIRVLLEKSVFDAKKLFSDPFKLFKPDVYELMYMMMSMLWDLTNVVGIEVGTHEISTHIQEDLAEELHKYYVNDRKRPNYVSQIYKIRHLLQGLDKVTTMRKEDGYMARTFNVFKHDIYLNDLK